MAQQIKDGAGTAVLAAVNSEQQLLTRSTTVGSEIFFNEKGDAYNLNTGVINLTNATETPVFYLKNNEENDMIISGVVIGIWASDGDGLDMLSTFIRNPTTGTIISSTPTNVDINSNRNYGSSNTLKADVYKGATGDTMTDGDDHVLVRVSEESRNFIGINEILPKGSSFGVKLTPPTSNTSMNCYVAVICYLTD